MAQATRVVGLCVWRKEDGAKLDYEKALLSPASIFEKPEDVLTCKGLTARQRIEVLRGREYDESKVAVAVEGGARWESTLLQRILIALEQLPGGIDAEHIGPDEAARASCLGPDTYAQGVRDRRS
ncbi:hypothetical protein [Chelativorans xinjiangense]|uniref:hypothetical protein n=1 Tax=Chelativorans xinjiangense TaxID=2681485 RepID=UPI00135B6B5E|nr:hypothetical protein [Chelativorans xinjiangense]